MCTEQHVSIAGNKTYGTAREGQNQPNYYVCAKRPAAKKREDLAATSHLPSTYWINLSRAESGFH